MAQSNLVLKKLTLQAFRSFVSRQELSLPPAGMHLINASSGHGKTSLVEGIAFPLGYSQYPATELQSWSWLTDSPMFSELEMEANGQQVLLRKGKSPCLKVGDEAAVTSASAISDRLPKVLGVAPETLKALTYRPQRERGMFLGFVDSKKKTFLTELLQLHKLEQKIEELQKNITALKKDRDLAEAKHNQALGMIPPEPQSPLPGDTFELQQQISVKSAEIELLQEGIRKYSAELDRLRKENREKELAIYQSFESPLASVKSQIESKRRQDFVQNAQAQAELELLRSRLKLLQDRIATLKADHKKKIQDCDRLIADLGAHRSKLQVIASKRNDAAKRREEVLQALEKIEQKKICCTCLRPWDGADNSVLRDTIATYKGQLASLEATVVAADQALSQLVAVEAELNKHNEQKQQLLATDPVGEKILAGEQQYRDLLAEAVARLAGERERFDINKRAEISALEADFSNLQAAMQGQLAAVLNQDDVLRINEDTKKLQAQIAVTESQLRLLRDKLELVVRSNSVAEARFQQEMSSYRQLLAAAAKASDALNTVVAKLSATEDVHCLLDSFLNLVFDETLQLIAARANDLIEGVPNVFGFSLEFQSDRETKSGTIKQEIRLVVHKNGHSVPFRSGCSGGQQAVIELAVDLALASVIAERTGLYPGWLVLDEPFDGLGTADKEAVLALLARVATERAVFVIDHATEVKEAFDSVIDVDYEDNCSRIASSVL